MTAMADLEEAYPGIYVDGQDKDEELLYLGAFELPNESFPCRITGRLYAGYASFETDGPIAMVTHDVMDREKKKQREKRAEKPRPLRKLVYVDEDLAGSRCLEGYKARMLGHPEHGEDE